MGVIPMGVQMREEDAMRPALVGVGLRNWRWVMGGVDCGRSWIDDDAYAEWVRAYDLASDRSRGVLRRRVTVLARTPIISVLITTSGSDASFLVEAIESVRAQIYAHWELCILDEASREPALREALLRYARDDPRIKVIRREAQGGISAGLNCVLDIVSGEWITFLGEHDRLSEHALYWTAEAINGGPTRSLIYSDEDAFDSSRRRPHFKPDWNRDLFYSHNYIADLCAIRRDLVRDVGGFRIGFESAHEYDLILRCAERLSADAIYHIPRVLYHRRIDDRRESKGEGSVAAERALNEHFKREKIDATAKSVGFGNRVTYRLPDRLPLVSIIIPTRDRLDLLRPCVKSIFTKTTYGSYEVVIVDNGSTDAETLAYLKELAANRRAIVIRDDGPFNYSALMNSAVAQVSGDLVALVNNDIEVVSPDWLSEMVSIALQPGVGAVGARLWYPDGTLQHAGMIVGLGVGAGHPFSRLNRDDAGYFSRAALSQSFSSITGACVVVRKELYVEVGGMNETALKVALNDVDLCLRLREHGCRNVWTPYAELIHHESASRGHDNTVERATRATREAIWMKERWGDLLLYDPAYNPNLTLKESNFGLAWPPRVECI